MKRWLPVPEYESCYEVSESGKVRRIRQNGVRNSPLVPNITRNGYERVTLSCQAVSRKFYVHTIVAAAFLPVDQEKPQINHIDGNKRNNSLTNLERVTPGENIRHAISTGLTSFDRLCRPVDQLDRRSGQLLARHPSLTEAGQSVGTHKENIYKACTGRRKSAGGYAWRYAADRRNFA